MLNKLSELARKNAHNEASAITAFEPIADAIMNKCILMSKGKEYRITEIEFYLWAARHTDESVHCDPRQELNEEWYIHRQGRKYAAFAQRMGIDIALGSPGEYFGILLRAVENISGPCKLLRALLAPEEYAKTEEFNIFDTRSPLYLKQTELPAREIKWLPRTGINPARYPAAAMLKYKAVLT